MRLAAEDAQPEISEEVGVDHRDPLEDLFAEVDVDGLQPQRNTFGRLRVADVRQGTERQELAETRLAAARVQGARRQVLCGDLVADVRLPRTGDDLAVRVEQRNAAHQGVVENDLVEQGRRQTLLLQGFGRGQGSENPEASGDGVERVRDVLVENQCQGLEAVPERVLGLAFEHADAVEVGRPDEGLQGDDEKHEQPAQASRRKTMLDQPPQCAMGFRREGGAPTGTGRGRQDRRGQGGGQRLSLVSYGSV